MARSAAVYCTNWIWRKPELLHRKGLSASVVVHENLPRRYAVVARSPKLEHIRIQNQIGRKLQAASNKILVVVDDIDRLSGSEVREVFRLIKSVGDFPNVTYLLAFDREAVCRMLEPVQGGTGEEYLGKPL